MKDAPLTINSVGDLQIALLENNNDAIKNYIERLDRETANEAMTRAGEFFGFSTVEIEGVVRTSGGHLAKVFGYKLSHGLAQLLKTRGIEGVKMGGFTQDMCIQIREKLNLPQDDHKSILYDWPAFLIGGMNSTNEEARVVQAYLLKMEKIARIGIVATKHAQLMSNFPDPSHGAVMAKLADRAWKGNPLASYILEKHYDVPVKHLLHRTDPELSETAGIISQFLHFVCEDQLTAHGLQVFKTERGYKIIGSPEMLYKTFLEIARRHHLMQFFGSVFSLGSIMSREADALEMLGWTRTVKKVQGYGRHTYEYTPEGPPAEIGMN
jgi:hypothetical protein